MQLYEELIIGFDAREMWLSYDTRWTPEHRNSLLRQDLIKLLSVDSVVWPSIFKPNFTIIGGTDWSKLPEATLEIPVQQQSEGFWTGLEALQAILASKWTDSDKPLWIIALTEFMHSQYKEELKVTYPFSPSEVSNDWLFLGYDIAHDLVLWSALSGEFYEPDEIQALKERWIPHLNEYPLFTDQHQADQFADWADSRDRGHAPHSIHGLYLIQKVEKP